MDFEKRRWISLLAGVIIEVLAGSGYAWSVFTVPLSEKFGWTMSQLSMVYTISTVSMMLSTMFLVPIVRRKTNIKNCILLGGLLYGVGGVLGGWISNIYLFYLVYSVLRGVGNALVYPVLISYSLELFPEKTGFSSGIMAAGYGFGCLGGCGKQLAH